MGSVKSAGAEKWKALGGAPWKALGGAPWKALGGAGAGGLRTCGARRCTPSSFARLLGRFANRPGYVTGYITSLELLPRDNLIPRYSGPEAKGEKRENSETAAHIHAASHQEEDAREFLLPLRPAKMNGEFVISSG